MAERGRQGERLTGGPASWLLAALCGLVAPAAAIAQPATSQTFTLEQALQYALDHYPAVQAAIEQVNASAAGVGVSRGAYLPRLDSLWQSNRGTANNVVGQVLPQSVIPSLTGPALPSSSGESVWGSAAGALLSWEPFDFGLRRAAVGASRSALSGARAKEALTRLDVQREVGEAFLALLGAEREVTVAQADFDRRDVLARAAHTLVDNQLRPGVEASRADAERAAARTRLIQAEEARTLALAEIARMLGLPALNFDIEGADLLDRLPPAEVGVGPAADHPLARVRRAAVDEARAQEEVLARTDLPRFYVQSSVFARGSGASPSGQLNGGFSGLGLDRTNWAAGVQVLFPDFFDFVTLRARKASAAASERAQTALYDEALLTITSEQQAASAMLKAARAVAENTPIQLAAAQQTESQARARFQSGLASIVEVAEAQSLLAQAEVQDQLARVDVWRALLASSAAQGDLTTFIGLVHSSGAR